MPAEEYDPYFSELEKIEDFLAKIKKHVPLESIPVALKRDYLAAVDATKALRYHGKVIIKSAIKIYSCYRIKRPCPEGQLYEDGGAG
jgi:uncharacterized FlgJ-related protein